jgi:hypothetical protein
MSACITSYVKNVVLGCADRICIWLSGMLHPFALVPVCEGTDVTDSLTAILDLLNAQ